MSTAIGMWRFPQKPPGGVPEDTDCKWIFTRGFNEQSNRSRPVSPETGLEELPRATITTLIMDHFRRFWPTGQNRKLELIEDPCHSTDLEVPPTAPIAQLLVERPRTYCCAHWDWPTTANLEVPPTAPIAVFLVYSHSGCQNQ